MFPVSEGEATGAGSDLSSVSVQLSEALLQLLHRLFEKQRERGTGNGERGEPEMARTGDGENRRPGEPEMARTGDGENRGRRELEERGVSESELLDDRAVVEFDDDLTLGERDARDDLPSVDFDDRSVVEFDDDLTLGERDAGVDSPFLGEFRLECDGKALSASEISPSLIHSIERAGRSAPGEEVEGVNSLKVTRGERVVLEVGSGTVWVNDAVAPGLRLERPREGAAPAAAAQSGLERVSQGVESLGEIPLEGVLKEVLSEVAQLRAQLLRVAPQEERMGEDGARSPSRGPETAFLGKGWAQPAEVKTARTLRDFFEHSAVRQNRYDTADYRLERAGKTYRVRSSEGKELMQFRDSFWGGVKVEAVSDDRDAIARLHSHAASLKEEMDLQVEATGAFAPVGRFEAARLARSMQIAEDLVEMARALGGRVEVNGQESYRFLATGDGGVRIDAKDERGTIFYRRGNGEMTNLMAERDLAYFEEAIPMMQFRSRAAQRLPHARSSPQAPSPSDRSLPGRAPSSPPSPQRSSRGKGGVEL
ncbi:MAG: hypothetical protein SVX43_01700 [Cyanobacteriota bacterium]|nr:hypothetical protein [Cyanobacteriota bacterium]